MRWWRSGQSKTTVTAAVRPCAGLSLTELSGDGTSSGAWLQLGSDIDGEAAGDSSGNSVTLSADGQTVAMELPNDGNGNSSGHVRFTAGQIRAGANSGRILMVKRWKTIQASVSMSVDGETVAIGAATTATATIRSSGFTAGQVPHGASSGRILMVKRTRTSVRCPSTVRQWRSGQSKTTVMATIPVMFGFSWTVPRRPTRRRILMVKRQAITQAVRLMSVNGETVAIGAAQTTAMATSRSCSGLPLDRFRMAPGRGGY